MSPEWYGRKAPTTPLPAAFIRAMATPRDNGMRGLTPPEFAGEFPVIEIVLGLAVAAGLGGVLLLWLG